MNYIAFSNIAARVMRRALKPEYMKEALEREKSHIKFTKWVNGKPVIPPKPIIILTPSEK